MIAWICAGVGLLCCLSAFAGLYYANEGKKAGDPQAQTALIANVVVLAISGMISLLVLIAMAGSTTYTTY
jgi:hypothetical protein